MHQYRTTLMLLTLMIAILIGAGAISAQDEPAIPDVEGNIYELAMRYIVDQENFPTLYGALQAAIADANSNAVIYSGEFNSIFGLAPELDPERPIQIGISQYTSIEDYFALAGMVDPALVEEYFTTIETIQNVLMVPFDGEAVDASELSECGVLEVAVRDISGYADVEDFYAKMDAFIDVLAAQEGVIREYQFISLEGTHFVGMTCYESPDAFMTISSDPALLEDPAVTAMFAEYPPLAAQISVPIPVTDGADANVLPEMVEVEGNIYELAMRYIVDQERFAELSAQMGALIAEYPIEVVIYSGEFSSIFGLAPELDPERPIQIGISQYTSVEDYFGMGGELINNPIVQEYFTTIETIQNVLMVPFDGEPVDASELSECGVLEVAVRDISGYADVEDFYAKMDAFIEVLAAQEGVVREYQFISLEGTHFVGMTCYESPDAFMAISSDPALLEDPAVTAMFAEYPPLAAQITVPLTN